MWRNWFVTSFVMLAVTFGLSEAACRFFMEAQLSKKFAVLHSAQWQRLTAPIPDFNISRNFDYGVPQVAHPYFGHVPTPAIADFEDTPKYTSRFEKDEVFRKTRTVDEFVIGIFGGSVADDLARWEKQTQTIESSLKQSFPTLQKRNFKLINFATVRGSQPRQFFIASLYGQSLDLAINLEGFNELNETRPIQYPPYFPGANFDKLFFQRSHSAMLISHEFILSAIKYDRLRVEVFDSPSFSSFFRSVKLAQLILLNKKLKEIEASQPDENVPKQLNMRSSTTAELIEFWHSQSQNQALLLARQKIPTFFFQQPNPAVPGSKHLTGVEAQDQVQRWTDLTTGQINAENIFSSDAEMNFKSLLWIFRDEPRTVYSDSCCHLNSLGNEIISQAIVRSISSKLICPDGEACYLRGSKSH